MREELEPSEEVLRFSRDAIAGSTLHASANVIMQLAQLPVGRGVAESTVDSGRVDLHPIKRARTTGSYLIVALLGDDRARATMRDEVNRAHREVRSPPDHDVAYNAFDHELQLWVAACLYKGFADWLDLFRGPLTDAQHDAFYRHAARFGTTLQVPADRWPADRAAFAAYWSAKEAEIRMDDVTRGYLRELARLGFLPGVVSAPLAPLHRFITVGFLPPAFRHELREPWTARDQARWDRLIKGIVAVENRLPEAIRYAILRAYERDVRRRIEQGRPIV